MSLVQGDLCKGLVLLRRAPSGASARAQTGAACTQALARICRERSTLVYLQLR